MVGEDERRQTQFAHSIATSTAGVLFGMRQRLTGGLIGVLGLSVWAITMLGAGSQLGIIRSLLLVGPLMIVPLGLASIQPSAAWKSLFGLAVLPALIISSGSDDRRVAAVALAGAWLLATIAIALPPISSWLAHPIGNRFALNNLLPLAAVAELVVAASWLVAATMQIELLGFSRTIVLLTAVHFHMAGFGACTVAVIRMRNAATDAERRWAGRGALLVLGASPVVAIGHLTAGALELTGGILLTAGVWIIAYLGWRESKRSPLSQSIESPDDRPFGLAPLATRSIVRVLLIIGASSPVVPMLFAIHYGITRISDLQQIRYSTIALIHGGLNAFGFLAANLEAEFLRQRVSKVSGSSEMSGVWVGHP
jgi:YndJ-like protein